MTMHPEALVAIVLMGIITYALRAGGFWLMGRVTLSPRVEAGLAYLPGAVITALVVPSVVAEGVAGVAGLAAVAIAMWIRPNLMLSLIAGIGTVVLVRSVT